MFVWVTRTVEKGQTGFGLHQQFETECQYWTKVLKRVVAVVKFLSELGIAFRGDSNTFGSPGVGNYLWCLELISQFDPYLRASIAHFGNAQKRTQSYLSTTICDVCSVEGGDKFCQKAQITFKQANIFPLVYNLRQTYPTQISLNVLIGKDFTVTQDRLLLILVSLFWESWALISETAVVSATTTVNVVIIQWMLLKTWQNATKLWVYVGKCNLWNTVLQRV